MRLCSVLIVALTAAASAQTTQPTTRPTPGAGALQQLLAPSSPADQPIAPILDKPTFDAKTGAASVAPGAPTLNLIREGTYIPNRVGRLTRTPDGQFEFTFEADGKNLADPPMVILPNQLLMQMELAVTNASRDLKFRITGKVTEYKGRNYVLLEKVVVVQDSTQPLK